MNAMLNNFIFFCLAVIATSAPVPDARMIRTTRSTDVIDHVSVDQTSYNTELISELKNLLSLLIKKTPKNNLEALKCEVATNPLKKLFIFSNLEGKLFPSENPSYSTKIKVPNRNSFVEINYYDLETTSSDNHNVPNTEINTTQESSLIENYNDDIPNSTTTINRSKQNNTLDFKNSLNKSSQFEQNTNSFDNEENFTKRYNMGGNNTLLIMDLKLNNDSQSTLLQQNDIEWSKNSSNTANEGNGYSGRSEINKSQREVPTIGQITQNAITPFLGSDNSSSESTKVIYQETQYNLQNKNNINASTQSMVNEEHHTSEMTYKINSSGSNNVDNLNGNYIEEITSKSIQLLNKTLEINSQPSTNHNLIKQTTNKNINASFPFTKNSLSVLNNDQSEMPNLSELNNVTNVLSKDILISETDSSYANTQTNNNPKEYKINLYEFELKQHVTTPIYTGDSLYEEYTTNNYKSTISPSVNTNTGNEFNDEISDSTSETLPLIYSTYSLSHQNRYSKEENWNELMNTTESDKLLTNSSNNFISAQFAPTNPKETPISDTEVTSSSLFHTYSTNNLSYISFPEESDTSDVNNVFIAKSTELDTVINNENSKNSSFIITSVFDKNIESSNSKNFEITTPAYFPNPQTSNFYSDLNIITTNGHNDNSLYDYIQNTIETDTDLVVTNIKLNVNSDKFEIGLYPTESSTVPIEQNMYEKNLQSTAEIVTENANDFSHVSSVTGATKAFKKVYPFSDQGNAITINGDSSTLEFQSSSSKLDNTVHEESSASMRINGEINTKSSFSITDIESNKEHYTTKSDYSSSDTEEKNNGSTETDPETRLTIVDIFTESNKLSVNRYSPFQPGLKEESRTQITSNYTPQENNMLFASSSTSKSPVKEMNKEWIFEDNNQIPESNGTDISTTESNYTLQPIVEITSEISNIEVRPPTENNVTSVSKLFNYSTNNIFISTPVLNSSKANMSATYSSFEAKDITKAEPENNSKHYTESHLIDSSTIRTTAMMDFNNFTFSLPSTQHVIAFIPIKVHSVKSVGQIL